MGSLQSEWDQVPIFLGHGVEFHTDPSPQRDTLVALLDGYEWLHGKPKVVPIVIRKADNKYSASFLMAVQKQIEDRLEAGKLKHGRLGNHLYAWFNA